MSQPTADRNLLFGVLALQMDFIKREQLIAAMQAWVFDKSKPLGEILCTQKSLTLENRALLEALVEKHMALHQNDLEKSLASVSATEVVRELASIPDPDLQASLGHLSSGSATDVDMYATLAPEGSATATMSPVSAVKTHSGGPVRFRIVRPHAKGGLGEVFVARDEELNREVALKEIQDRQADNLDSRSRFMLEAEITGGLEHPGIVPVYGLGTYPDGRPYYAMRFIRGDSLKEAIERFHRADAAGMDPGQRTLDLRALLGRFIDVCNAIAYAHDRGVLHRDLKPGNIMLGKYGETLVVDWGLAKPMGLKPGETKQAGEISEPGSGSLMPASMSATTETMMGAAVGTPQYMSPEQAAGRLDQLGPASDVYSLGATLFCLLAGKSPVADTDVGAVLQRVQRGDFLRLRAVKPDVSPPLEAICMKALALKPADRYVSPRMLADDIEHWLADEPVSAYPEPWTVKARRWINRHRTLVTGVAAAVVVAVIGLTIATILLTAANERERQAKQKAEENFQLARDSVDRYLTAVKDDDLLKEKGLQPLRKTLLDAAREFNQKFVDRHRGDPTLQGELAKATFRLGLITGEIGSRKEAIDLLQQAATMFERLPKDKGGPDFTADQATCYHYLGRHLRQDDQITQSEQAYGKAFTLWERLTAAHPNEEAYQVGLARTEMGIANAHVVARRFAPAQGLYEKSLNGWTALAKVHPEAPVYQREIAANQRNLAEIYLALADRDKDAENALRAAQATQKKLADDWPNISKYRDDLGAVNFTLARLLARSQKLADAGEFFAESVECWEALTTQQPAVTSFQVRLADAYMAVANIYRDSDWNKAEAACQKALTIQRKLLAKNPSDPNTQGELAKGLVTLADIYRFDRKIDRTQEAVAALNEAIRVQEKLVVDQKQAPHHLRDLARTYSSLGFVNARNLPEWNVARWGFEPAMIIVSPNPMKDTRRQSAESAFKNAAAHWEKLVREHPDDQEYALGYANACYNLGMLNRWASNPKEAEIWFARALQPFESDKAMLTATANMKATALLALTMHADSLRQLNRHPDALKDWDRAVAIAGKANTSVTVPHAAALARVGRYTEAVNEVEPLVAKKPASLVAKNVKPELAKKKEGEIQYDLARVYALSITAVLVDPTRSTEEKEKLADQYALQAMKRLDFANAVEYFETGASREKLKADPDLQALRTRTDFQKLATELKAN